MELKTRVVRAFEERFGEAPAFVVRAPGRVNLIGEHTDYNDGFVLPAAIDRAVWLALRPRGDGTVRVRSLERGEASFEVDALERGDGWVEYPKGVAWALQEDGETLKGWEGVLTSDVPVGSGLSSSAALELAAMRAFAASSGFSWEPKRIARLAQRAENAWLGVSSGIMDQLISAAGRPERALLIDCRTLELEAVPLPPGTVVAVLDTATRRGLVGSAYNERRRQCEEAAAFFRAEALRDVTLETFKARALELDPLTRRRARHVITENARTLAAAAAMRRGDAAALGAFMNASHASLRDDFEVSSPELDLMAETAAAHDACLGARMTGAGFGGCAVALVREEGAAAFSEQVAARYEQETGLEPAVYLCAVTAGASLAALP